VQRLKSSYQTLRTSKNKINTSETFNKVNKKLGLFILDFRELYLATVYLSAYVSHRPFEKSGRDKISILYCKDQLFVKSAHYFDQVNTLYNILQEI